MSGFGFWLPTSAGGGGGGAAAPVVVRTGLTNKLNWSAVNPMEQWGSEEAVCAFANLPASTVQVAAWLTGTARNLDGALRAGDSRVEISLDGGATWSTGQPTYCEIPPSGGTNPGYPVSALMSTSGTPSGDVQARAMASVYNATTGPDRIQGSLLMIVFPA